MGRNKGAISNLAGRVKDTSAYITKLAIGIAV